MKLSLIYHQSAQEWTVDEFEEVLNDSLEIDKREGCKCICYQKKTDMSKAVKAGNWPMFHIKSCFIIFPYISPTFERKRKFYTNSIELQYISINLPIVSPRTAAGILEPSTKTRGEMLMVDGFTSSAWLESDLFDSSRLVRIWSNLRKQHI